MKRNTFRNLKEANRATFLYIRADEAWRRGDLLSAFRLHLAAAEAGMAPAFRVVGQFYERGEGVKKNEEAAVYWYRRAAQNGDYSAANNVGCIWRDRGNLARALQWFKRAAKLGDADANLNIARTYVLRSEPARARPYLNKVLRSAWSTEQSKEEAQALLKQIARRRGRG